MSTFLEIFGGDEPLQQLTLFQVAARAIAIYVCGVVLVRLGKSRLLARATGIDILVGFLLGSLLSRAITGLASLSETIVASTVIIAGHALLTAATCRWHAFGKLVKGNSVMLIRDGVVLWDNMYKSHISENDLMEALRLNAHTENPEEIARAYKERNGEISAIPKSRTSS
jgi:uncharacterized membrane protein YcaP (DUF421 family)